MTLLVVLAQQVEKQPYIILMNEASLVCRGNVGPLLGTEELPKLKRGIVAQARLDQLAKVVGSYLHLGQFAVRIVGSRLVGVFLGPQLLCGLLLDVVPSVYLVVIKVFV